jgi:hypothetical protein
MNVSVVPKESIVIPNKPVHGYAERTKFYDGLPGIGYGVHSKPGPIVEPVSHEDDDIAIVFFDLLAEPLNEVPAVNIVLLAVAFGTKMDVTKNSGSFE